MTEGTLPNEDQSKIKDRIHFGQWLVFILKGFIFPLFSLNFYREVSKKKITTPILFFLIFAAVVSAITTVVMGIAMGSAATSIRTAYEKGEFPTIEIRGGVAYVDGPQPFVYEQARQLIAIDTTGEINEIVTHKYSEGILLTRTELHLVNEDGYRKIPLSDFHQGFGDPIVIDESRVMSVWGLFVGIMLLIVFLGLLAWNAVVKFIYLAMLGIIIWGIAYFFRKGTRYETTLATGIFVHVPVFYLTILLGFVNIDFCGMYTLLLITAWSLVMWLLLRQQMISVIRSEDMVG